MESGESTAMPAASPTISACSRVLNVTELLEEILLKLPMQDLLRSQGVNKTWKELINVSKPIRRALFFEPAVPCNIRYMDWRMDDHRCYERLGARTARSQHPVRYQNHWGRTRDDNAHRIFVNPLLAREFPALSPLGLHVVQPISSLSQAMKRPYASWRFMSPFQPFVEAVVVEGGDSKPNQWRPIVLMVPAVSRPLLMMSLLRAMNMVGNMAWISGSEEFEEWNQVDDLKMVLSPKKALEPSKR